MKKFRSFAAVVRVLAAAVVLAFAASACDEPPENMLPPVASGTVVVTPVASIPTNVEPSIRGYVTRITYAAEYTEILVEYFPKNVEEPEFSFTKVLLKLDDKSAVAFGKNNDAYTRTLLSVGSKVEAWFSDPTAESSPVIAYGQAVRVVQAPSSMTSIGSLPYLSAASGSTCATVVTSASWNGQKYNISVPLDEMLDEVAGAHMSAAQEDNISLKFSVAPDDLRVFWSSSPYSNGREITLTDGKIALPEISKGKIFIRVEAVWGNNIAKYVFTVTVQEVQEQ